MIRPLQAAIRRREELAIELLARGLSVRDIEDAFKDESQLLRFANASAVAAFLSNGLIAMVSRRSLRTASHMNPRTRYWIVHWLDALTRPASLVLIGIRTMVRTVGRVIRRRA